MQEAQKWLWRIRLKKKTVHQNLSFKVREYTCNYIGDKEVQGDEFRDRGSGLEQNLWYDKDFVY